MAVSYMYEELVILRLLELNSLMPHYWSEFFVLAFQLLDEEKKKILKSKLEEVEEMVLEKEYLYNIYKCLDCKYKFKTKKDWFDIQNCPKCSSQNIKTLRNRLSFYDIEMCMESNRDFNAFFIRYGDRISKNDIERKLILIKQFLFEEIRRISVARRFKRFR